MNSKELPQHVESLLFVLGRPLTRKELVEKLECSLEELELALHQLSSQAGERGVTQRAPAIRASDGFGDPPSRDAWEPAAVDYPRELWGAFKSKR